MVPSEIFFVGSVLQVIKEQTFKGNKKVSMHIMAGYEAFLSRRNTEEDL